MNKHRDEKYALAALNVLKKANTTTVASTLNSKAAAFCPTVISIGLLPTVVLYSDDDTEKNDILKDLWAILKEDKNLNIASNKNLLDYVSNGNDNRHLMRGSIMAAANAYKKVLRTYPEKKNNANVENVNGGETT